MLRRCGREKTELSFFQTLNTETLSSCNSSSSRTVSPQGLCQRELNEFFRTYKITSKNVSHSMRFLIDPATVRGDLLHYVEVGKLSGFTSNTLSIRAKLTGLHTPSFLRAANKCSALRARRVAAKSSFCEPRRLQDTIGAAIYIHQLAGYTLTRATKKVDSDTTVSNNLSPPPTLFGTSRRPTPGGITLFKYRTHAKTHPTTRLLI